MPSKFDQLRQGQAVEIEPGVSGRLNKESKRLELSTGEVLDVGNNPNFFPKNERDLGISRQKENIERKAKGAGGEFYHQFSNQGLAGSASDIVSYLTQTGEDYANRKVAEQQVSQRISQESPYTSAAATAASFVPDVIATRGMSALKAAPLLTAGSSGSRLITNPEEVAAESALSAGLGFGLDKASGYLGRVAQRRAESRALPALQQNVRNSNIAGQQATQEANALQTQQFNALRQNVKSVNESRLQQYEKDLNARQNTIIQEQNAYEQRKLQRDAEVVRLKNKAEMEKAQRSVSAEMAEAEYRTAKDAADQENKRMAEKFKMDQSQYQQDLKKIPEMQRQAQKEFSENVIKNAESISNSFPKDSKIFSNQFKVPDFIENSIQKSAIAGTREANQASRILKSIFPEGEILTGKELSSRYRALEGAIQKSTPEVRDVLNQFKMHMGEQLPQILADNIAYSRVMPTIGKQIQKEVASVLDSMGLAESGIASRSYLKNRAASNVNTLFRNISPENFAIKMQNGEIREQILRNILSPGDFSSGLGNLKSVKKPMSVSSDELQRLGINIPNPSQSKYDEFTNLLSNKLDKALAKAELKMIATDVDAANKLGAKVKKTYGTAQPVTPPNSPVAPQPIPLPAAPSPLPPINSPTLPPPVAPYQTPGIPPKPSLLPNPTAPTPQSFIAQPEPSLTPANGFAERTGDFLEKNLLGGNELGNNPISQSVGALGKLAGLKYLLGGAAVPAEAAYLGMRGLTSPTGAGQVARMSFQQGGIQAIENWAQSYPSYRNGILEAPQDRRSLTKQVEDASDIPIEQKAIIQSKINRGKPLQERL